MIFLRVASNGDLVWSKTFAGNGTAQCKSIHPTNTEGEVVFCGNAELRLPGQALDCVIGRMFVNGSLLWVRSIRGGAGSCFCQSIIETSAGDLVFTGGNYQHGGPFIAKLNSSGHIVWTRTLSGGGYGKSIAETNQGDFVFTGYTSSCCGGAGDREILLTKFSPNGTVSWIRTLGGEGIDEGYEVRMARDGMIVVSGCTNNFGVVSGGGVIFAKLHDEDWERNGCSRYWNTTFEGYVLIRNGESLLQLDVTEQILSKENDTTDYMYVENIHGTIVVNDIPNLLDGETYVCRTCIEGYQGEYCNVTSCHGIVSTNLENVCSGHGKCHKLDSCDCEKDYYGIYCNTTVCHGLFSNVTSEVCSTHGSCDMPDHCVCLEKYFGKICNETLCGGIWNNVSSICSTHGECSNYDTCVCSTNYYGRQCNVTKCFGFFSNSSLACSGHGQCALPNDCVCLNNYTHREEIGHYNCSNWKCFGVWMDDDEVCTALGNCSSPDTCDCHSPFYNQSVDCSEWKCSGVWNNEEKYVCSGHGNCTAHETCVCPDAYPGPSCNHWTCNYVPVTDFEKVCSGHGSCVDFDICSCDNGYSSLVTFCSDYYCGDLHYSDHSEVCSGRGSCVGPDRCACLEEYEGQNCETWSCYGTVKDDSGVCSGHGECNKNGKCECATNWGRKDCSYNYGLAVGLGVSLPILAVTCCCFLLFITCGGMVCTLCACSLFLFGLWWVAATIGKQRKRISRFSRLRNLEVLLHEQELEDAEDGENKAKLNIQKNLFQINMDEIKTISILGEGGSNSIVFKAIWMGKTIAFKCFKTRKLMQSQDQFEEFEREVEILSCLGHPNIIQFFGACLKVPRVGIVMEFCPKGEILDFILNFRGKFEMGYPIVQKIRLVTEVCSALCYLHSKNVMHRDLKCENVLISENDSAKLMDFGLSRSVERMSVEKTKRIGTNVYIAPEVVTSSTYDEKCDVFSLSVMMYVVFTENNTPYHGLAEEYQIELRVANDPKFRPPISHFEKAMAGDFKWLSKLIERCWSHKPEERYSMNEIREILERGSVENVEKSMTSSVNERKVRYKATEEESSGKEEDNSRLKKKVKEQEEKIHELMKEVEELRRHIDKK